MQFDPEELKNSIKNAVHGAAVWFAKGLAAAGSRLREIWERAAAAGTRTWSRILHAVSGFAKAGKTALTKGKAAVSRKAARLVKTGPDRPAAAGTEASQNVFRRPFRKTFRKVSRRISLKLSRFFSPRDSRKNSRHYFPEDFRKSSGRRRRRRRRRRDAWVLPVLVGASSLLLAGGIILFYSTPAGMLQGSKSPGAGGEPAVKIGTFRDGTAAAAASESLPLADAFRGILSGAQGAALSARDAALQSLTDSYLERLDRGAGASYLPETEKERVLWEKVREERRAALLEDPFLLLVNKWHYLPEDYEADPVDLPNGQRIDRRCYEPLMQMLADCASEGGTPIVCSGYRPHWYQENLFDAQINRWLYAGYGQEDAEALAATAVAIPGTSEHELGFAADIYSSENMNLDESQIYTFTQQWLMENSWRYGFVLRYPQEKSEITGIIFEPWHYRYVGKEHAKKIYDAGICLEEYLDLADHP